MSGSRSSRVWLWLLRYPFHFREIFSDSRISIACTRIPRASPSCMATIQRFTRALGLSSRVANQLSFCRRQSSQRLYQHRWECYRSWCHSKGHSVSVPTVVKIADFLCFLRLEKHLSVSAIKGYCPTLSAVFKFHLPELGDNFILRDLIRSFELQRPHRPVRPPSWDLVKVLTYLCGPVF